MHIIAAGIMKKRAFNNVIVNGIVLAEDGKKMSKKLQNYPDPASVLDVYGADALRQYLLNSPVMLADNLCFSEDGVKEAKRKNIMLVWNVYKFYEMFASEAVSENEKIESDNVLDKWILVRLNQLIKTVTEEMDKYNLPLASRPITDFIDDLSTWYIRRSRDRFKGADKEDRDKALAVTGFVLKELAKVIAPFMPFIAEQVWQKVTGNDFKDENKSIHLELWPEHGNMGTQEHKNMDIISDMEKVRKIVELGLSKRDEASIKVRQPLSQLRIKNYELKEEYVDLVKDELNVKEVISEKGDGDISVELDTEITPELELEGIKREIVRSINVIRKEKELSINDRVLIYYQSPSEKINKAIEDYKDEIIKETLADDILKGETEKDLKINGGPFSLGVKKN
jgi:isoleucyl-tRNA synthetase